MSWPKADADAAAHAIDIQWYTDDTGIWLVCDCGWEKCMEYEDTTLERANALAAAHHAEVNAETHRRYDSDEFDYSGCVVCDRDGDTLGWPCPIVAARAQ